MEHGPAGVREAVQHIAHPTHRCRTAGPKQRPRARCRQSSDAFDASLTEHERDRHGIERNPKRPRRDRVRVDLRCVPVHAHRVQQRQGNPCAGVLHLTSALFDGLLDRH
jgi:hypothetical protein